MSFPKMHDEQVDTDAALVRRLLGAQQPQWADLPIERIRTDGTDNAIYRLGDDLVVRMPIIHWAVEQVHKEHTWLPRLAPHLPLALHEPLAMGEPGEDYPWHWSVYRWIEGENAEPDRLDDPCRAARDLAGFVHSLHALDTTGAPRSDRGRPLRLTDVTVRERLDLLRDRFDVDALLVAWEEALAAPRWDGPWVWAHTDLSDGNLLVRDGRLHAVIDLSLLGLADPAADLHVAWDLFTGESRAVFQEAVGYDDATWARARGWAVTGIFSMPYYDETNPGIVVRNTRKLEALIDEIRAR